MSNSYTASCQTWKWAKKLCPPVRHGCSQQSHLTVIRWWEENLTQRFSTYTCEGMGWEWTLTIQVCREICPCICKCQQIGHATSSTKRGCGVCFVQGVMQTLRSKCEIWFCFVRGQNMLHWPSHKRHPVALLLIHPLYKQLKPRPKCK